MGSMSRLNHFMKDFEEIYEFIILGGQESRQEKMGEFNGPFKKAFNHFFLMAKTHRRRVGIF
jgi:hypothetical protein